MNLEQQVCSLNLAERLKELGCKQESFWYWIETVNGWKLFQSLIEGNEDSFSAFTVAELGEMLPEKAGTKKNDREKGWLCFNDWGSYAWYMDGGNVPNLVIEVADTEADARAKMLIYLLENGLIDLRQIN